MICYYAGEVRQVSDCDAKSTLEDLFIHATIFVVMDRQGRLRGVLESMEDGWKEKAISIANSLLNESPK